MLSPEDLVSLVHESSDNPNQSSSSDDDESNLEIFNELDDLIDANLSSDPEKESHISLSESDKKQLSLIYPNQIICNEQFNSIFGIPKTSRKAWHQEQTEIDFNLKVCEDKVKKLERNKRIEKKLNKEFLRFDSSNRMLLKRKFLEESKAPNFNLNRENNDKTFLIQKEENTENIVYSYNQQSKHGSTDRNGNFVPSPKNLTYTVNDDLDDLIENTQQKLKYSIDNNDVSPRENQETECHFNSIEAKLVNLDASTPVKSKETVNLLESNLLKRRNKPTLILENLPNEAEEMPDSLKKESPNKRFDTNASENETILDRFAKHLSGVKEKPLVIKSTSGHLNDKKFSFNIENSRNLKTAPPILSTSKSNLIHEQNRTLGTNNEIVVESINSLLFDDQNFKINNEILKNFEKIKKIILKNFTQSEALNNPFNDNELAKKTNIICKAIHNEIKLVHFDKRKLIVNVFIGNINDEPLKIGTKCSWNNEFDNQTSFAHINDFLYCVINVFSVTF